MYVRTAVLKPILLGQTNTIVKEQTCRQPLPIRWSQPLSLLLGSTCAFTRHWQITTQYHAVFDDWFHTVGTSEAELPNFDSDEWYRTFGATEWQYVPEDGDPNPVQEPIGGYYTEALTCSENTRLAQEQEYHSLPSSSGDHHAGTPVPSPHVQAAPPQPSALQREKEPEKSTELPAPAPALRPNTSAINEQALPVPKFETPSWHLWRSRTLQKHLQRPRMPMLPSRPLLLRPHKIQNPQKCLLLPEHLGARLV